MKKTTRMLALFLTLGVSALGAQERARERARETLPAEVFRGIETRAQEAARNGTPTDPLFSKALEGMAKRVPADRIVSAVTAYAQRLREAQGAFGPGVGEPVVVAGADALQRGVEVQALRQLGRGGPEGQGGQGQGPGPSPMAVLVLADLVEAGVPAERALGVVHEALRQRTREQEMLGLTGQVRHLMRQGQTPQEAAEQVRRALQRGRGGGMAPPVPPGSEPVTSGRHKGGKGKGGG